MSENLKNRIESESKACCRITNNDLICKDCLYRFDDTFIFGNTSKCSKYDIKPDAVTTEGKCSFYKED